MQRFWVLMKNAFSEYTEWMSSSLLRYETLAKSLVAHKAEKGRIVESVVKSALNTILPHRFSIGTGFAITSSGKSSSQLDIVIYDSLKNSPIILDGGIGLFPIECIYGVIEVKSILDKKGIENSAAAIGTLRSYAKEKRYVIYGPHPDNKNIVGEYEYLNTLSPRSFILSINSKFSNLRKIRDNLKSFTEKYSAHIHGLYVMEKHWLISQIAHKNPHEFICEEDKSLAVFCATVLYCIQSIDIGAASMKHYLGIYRQGDD
jgi:hypothetical protein